MYPKLFPFLGLCLLFFGIISLLDGGQYSLDSAIVLVLSLFLLKA